METTEILKRKISTAEDLHAVVKTMKALAAVSIRQYEKAVESLTGYARTVEMGLRVVLQHVPESGFENYRAPVRGVGAVVFGSDQGMCGQINDQVVEHVLSALEALDLPPSRRAVLAVGERVTSRLIDAGVPVEDTLTVPGSAEAITWQAQDLLVRIEQWHERRNLDQILLYYNQPVTEAAFRPHTWQLLPVDPAWLSELASKPWKSRTLPMFTMDLDTLFSSLIRQYLFVSLYRAFAEALASEHASRLASMQHAQRNIEDRLDELRAQFRHSRQMAITEELLDIVAGFEALRPEL